MTDEILDIRSAAQYLHIKEQTLNRLVAESEISAIRVGDQWKFSKQSLDMLFFVGEEENESALI